MIWLTLITALALAPQAQQAANEPAKADAPAAVKAESATPASKPVSAEANASALNAKLLTITRIYVDDFGADPVAKQLQAMVINSVSESKRFIITENREKADAIMKGTALEKTSIEYHGLNDKAVAASSHSGYSDNISGSSSGGTASVSGSAHAFHIGSLVGADDSTASSETINDARVAVRLVAADGDVIWSTTQESRGAKYKGASADVADKVIKRLLSDLERLQTSAASAIEPK
jgi:membrane protein involved in colicin uptake